MDRSILTPKQCVTVSFLRLLQTKRLDEIIEAWDGMTVEDVRRRTLNREFMENGIDGVRLVESQVEN